MSKARTFIGELKEEFFNSTETLWENEVRANRARRPTSVAPNQLTSNNLAHRTGTKIAPVRCAKQFIQSHLSATHFNTQKADGIKK